MLKSILWFRQDLRLHDNEALHEAIRSSDELLPIFIFDPRDFRPLTRYGTSKTGVNRIRFLIESVNDLRNHLRSKGAELIVRTGKPEELLYELCSVHKINWVYCNRERTQEEANVQDSLEQKLWTIGREVRYGRGKMLYYTSDLPYPVTHCPDSFSMFRKETEHIMDVRLPLDVPASIPKFSDDIDPGDIPSISALTHNAQQHTIQAFAGGETEGLKALANFEINSKSNSLFSDGTSLSPWLSMGCLSPKKVYYESFHFKHGGEEIQQYLLNRDYLRLMGKKYGDRIFYKSGIKNTSIKYRQDSDALSKWQRGETGINIIDASMHQINTQGWAQDQLRRLVAGYFLKVLNLDWRLGAAYFESRLIDYDPCSNWVSWLNLAGIGPDTRDDRIINYDAVGKKMDPDGEYISYWKSIK